MKTLFIFFYCFLLAGCIYAGAQALPKQPFIVVLGVAQDAGYPQIGCEKACCLRAWKNPRQKRWVSSLAIADPVTHQWWLLDATPDIKEQLHLFQQLTHSDFPFLPDGIFLTHAHIGHYAGIMQLGREVMNSNKVSLYAMPRMSDFLKNNGPWSLLVQLQNIVLNPLQANHEIALNQNLYIKSFLVPHRDEFSETVGFEIKKGQQKILFIPDIDKWKKFDSRIDSLVKETTYSFLDGTFYKEGELEGRPMSEVPHPFITESMEQFQSLSTEGKKKIYFIHFNHTNPLLNEDSPEFKKLNRLFNTARQGGIYSF
ncbi:MAG: pyrroloquinoline quinone biosynthesis protein PqqB [Bacteroidetes bacterium]|nr:pyrroloquinoline quinone biosynthesis protein PqqB [Bacteroidota bacterium]